MHARAHIFSDERATKLPGVKSRAKKMIVVHQRVFNASRSERRWKLRLPNALRQPAAVRPTPKMLLDVISQSLDLLATILRRNRNQNRFIVTAADHLHLPARRQHTEQIEIFGM